MLERWSPCSRNRVMLGGGGRDGAGNNIIKDDTTSVLPILDSSKERVVEAFPKALTAVTLTL